MAKDPKCVLDSNDCVTLRSVIYTFNAPVSEDQAWALLFQASKTCNTLLHTGRQQLFLTEELHHIFLHKDGSVNDNTFSNQRNREPRRNVAVRSRRPAASEAELVSFLGQTVCKALEYGLLEHEEREMSPSLCELLHLMVAADESLERQETDDEGIERDSGESEDEHNDMSCSLLHVMQICAQQIQLSSSAAESHYKNVCRAFVAEALELSAFLELVHSKSELDSNSQERPPCTQQWAKQWLDVMGQLRTGIALRHVEVPEKLPPVSEMTPYEILMEDIRLKRFTLNKVGPPSPKKDTHAMILEFIRSRPPLRKASERPLKEKPQQPVSVVEQLMASIRSHDQRTLRKSSFRSTANVPKSSPLKKIECDPSLFEDVEDTDNSDTESCDGASAEEKKYSLSPVLHRSERYESNWRFASYQESRGQTTATASTRSLSAYGRNKNALCNPVFQHSCARLTLNLDEVIHIRSTLTKAEVERKADPKLKQDILRGKICACCKVRFSIFGPWSQNCHLCKQYVCSKCSFKASVPNTVFSQLPQWNLTPKSPSVPSINGPSSLSPSFRFSDTNTLSVNREISGPFSFGGLGTIERKRATPSLNSLRTDYVHMSAVCRDCRGLLHDLIASASTS